MIEYIYERPQQKPQDSPHWNALRHESGDSLIQDLNELKERFSAEIQNLTLTSRSSSNPVAAARGQSPDEGKVLAFWSCLLGYCEALSTNKNSTQRHSIYPIPSDALRRLVDEEFVPPPTTSREESQQALLDDDKEHRQAAKTVSNWVWSKVTSKSNAKDEQHANSVYTVVRAKVDRKSLDCFGAALSTVIALRQLGLHSSILTLSEDHAYESHPAAEGKMATCEIAIPGNTKAQQAKRGQETSKTFQDGKNSSDLNVETSWLYMGMAPVLCRTAPMIVAAAISNMNCLIDMSKGARPHEKYSKELMILKRELLWILKDTGHLDMFPFALCELGWSEEHCTSPRGEAMLNIAAETSKEPVTGMEALYHEAIACSRLHYLDKQVYPYAYLGFFHKDGGQAEEYRLPLALDAFAHAARVTSQYKYAWGDSLQLTKVMTTISEFIVFEILSCPNIREAGKRQVPRTWKDESNAIATGVGLVRFFDHLLAWEELTSDRFLVILQPSHKTGIVKAFALLEHQIRVKAFEKFAVATNTNANDEKRSRRMGGLVGAALQKPKVALQEIDLTIVASGRPRGSRIRKRKGR